MRNIAGDFGASTKGSFEFRHCCGQMTGHPEVIPGPTWHAGREGHRIKGLNRSYP